MRNRLRAALRDQDGYSLIELLVVMSILAIVLAGITGVFVSATAAEARQHRRVEAQIDGRLALDQLRVDAHCATTKTLGGSVVGTLNTQVTLSLSEGIGRCPTGTVVWCAIASGSSASLYRSSDATCNSSDRFYTDDLTSAGVFGSPDTLPVLALERLYVNFTINPFPVTSTDSYRLIDSIAMRNSVRS